MTQARATAQQYQNVEVQTADRGKVLLLVFEGGIKFLTLAENELRAGNLDAFIYNLGRAQAIITELLHTLNHEAGGTIARDLERLYRFGLEHLAEANLKKDPDMVAAVRRIIETIASGFREILADGVPRLAESNAA